MLFLCVRRSFFKYVPVRIHTLTYVYICMHTNTQLYLLHKLYLLQKEYTFCNSQIDLLPHQIVLLQLYLFFVHKGFFLSERTTPKKLFWTAKSRFAISSHCMFVYVYIYICICTSHMFATNDWSLDRLSSSNVWTFYRIFTMHFQNKLVEGQRAREESESERGRERVTHKSTHTHRNVNTQKQGCSLSLRLF